MHGYLTCPFCGARFVAAPLTLSDGGDLFTYECSSVECDCGATFATVRGRRSKCAEQKE